MMCGMRRLPLHILVALFAFGGGVYADSAAYRAVDYFWPDVTPGDVRAVELVEPVKVWREWSIKEYEEWNAKLMKARKSASDRSSSRRRVNE